MRAFIAIELSEEQKKKLGKFQEALKKAGAGLKLVEVENLHLTLRFLGEISEKELEKVKTGLEKTVSGQKSFTMSIKGVGVFPNMDYVKVIWSGIEKGKNELESLSQRVNNEITVGEKDERGFSAHITAARVKTAAGKEDLAKVLKEFATFEFGETAVSEVKVKESRLGSKGPNYSDFAIFKLEQKTY